MFGFGKRTNRRNATLTPGPGYQPFEAVSPTSTPAMGVNKTIKPPKPVRPVNAGIAPGPMKGLGTWN